MNHRIIAFLLCACLSLSVLASCADNEDKPDVVDPNVTEEADKDTPTFEEADFGGATITFIGYPDDFEWFQDNYIYNEERTGEPVNDAVVERNTLVAEKYNCEIVKRDGNTPTQYIDAASKSGTVDFDMAYDWGVRLGAGVIEGLYYDLNSMSYVDLSQSYWAPSTHDDLTIAGKMCVFMNDISMNRLAQTYLVAFNKTLISRYNLEMPYDLVDQNRWTFDKYFEMVKDIYEDVNGNTEPDIEDIFGSDSIGVSSIMEYAGMPLEYTLKNEDGSYKLNVYTEKMVQIYNDYAKKLLIASGFSRGISWSEDYDASLFINPPIQDLVLGFGGGHKVFSGLSVQQTAYLCEMTDEYGVVPNPKYDPAQKEYYHYIEPYAPMFSIVRQSPNLDELGIILEYMAYESERLVLPAFFEQTIKTKRMNDERDDRMLDIIRDSVHYCWTYVYERAIPDGEGGYWNPVATMLSDMLSSGNFGSVNKKYKDKAQKSLDDFYDFMLNLDLDK